MGSCENAVGAHEPVVGDCTEEHSGVEVGQNSVPGVSPCSENGPDLVDSGMFLVGVQKQCLELSRNGDDGISLSSDCVETAYVGTLVEVAAESGSGCGLFSRKLVGEECGTSGHCLNNCNADYTCSGGVVESEIVNKLPDLAVKRENVVCLVSEKSAAGGCGDSEYYLNEKLGRNIDSSAEYSELSVVKQGFTGGSNEPVGSLENSEGSARLSFVSDLIKEDCQTIDNEDDKSIAVKELMEEKNNHSAGMESAYDEKKTPPTGCEIHPKVKDVSSCSTFSSKQDEQDCVAHLESIIEERGADLYKLGPDNPVSLSYSVPGDKQKDDQIETIGKSSAEGVLEFVNAAAPVLTLIQTVPNQVMSLLAPANSLELPVIDSLEKVVEEDQEKDNDPVSAARDEGVKEMTNDVSSRTETVLCHNRPGVAEEKIGCRADLKDEIIDQIFFEDRNGKGQNEGSDEMPSSCFANKIFSPDSCQTLIVDESGFSKSSDPIGKDIKDSISFSNTVECPGQSDVRGEVEDIINHNSEFKCVDNILTSSQKSSQTSETIQKPQTKRASRKCRKKPVSSSSPNEIIESILKAPRSKRRLNSNLDRSNIWGSLYTTFFVPDNELKLNHVQNCGLQKSNVGKRNGKRTTSGVGGRSRRKSRDNRSSTSCIRLKVKVGKEVCQNSLGGMVPEVIDSSASTDAANTTSSKDKTSEIPANRGLEVPLNAENPAGDAAEHYLGVSDFAEAEQLEAVTGKRYNDPGTSPDSEVINSIPEGQIGAACQEDFHEAILISKSGTTAPNVTIGKKGKNKDRKLCSDSCLKKDKVFGASNKSKAKPRKKCQDGQRKDESVCSSEILASSTSVIAFSRQIKHGVSKEGLIADLNTEVKTHCDLDANLDLAGSHDLKNGLPLTKSTVRRKKSDKEGNETFKVHDPCGSKKKNGCRQRGNERKAVNKKKVEKNVFDQVNRVDDDSERGYHTVDENGKTDGADNAITMSMGMANLDLASSNVFDGNLPSDSAWVHCDDCHKWRRIPVSLVDSIGQTNCQWTCKDNMDKAFADCSIPQEKSNAEINAELGISDDVDEQAYNVPLNNKGLDSMHDRGSKEFEFTRISTNQFLHRSRKTQTIDEIMVCHCRPPLNGGLGCGDECLNRMLNIECVRGTCPCGDLCSNQQFQKRSYAKMRWNRCGKKGFGLQLEEDISKGQFLIEYVGEVLDMHTYEARQKEYASNGHKHFYFMTLDGSEVIDARAKGNLGRFINHSCDPNCRTEKWVVNGEICIGLFAVRDIKMGEEVTFDYNYVRVFGAAAKKCYCGSSQCRVYIGGDPSSTEVIDQVDSDEEFPEPVMIEEVKGRNGLQHKLSKRISSDAAEMQIAEDLSKNGDKMGNSRKLALKSEVINESTASTSLLDSSVEISDTKTCVQSCSEAVKTIIQADVSSKTTSSVQPDMLEETTENLSSSQSLEVLPSVNSKASSDGITNKKSKSGASEEKRVFVKSRFLIKPSHQPGIVRKEKPTVSSLNLIKSQTSTNKSQVASIKSKKLVEGVSNGRFEAVEEKLNELLDIDGGISKRKDAPKGYLKLLLHTAASGANKNGEAIQSNRDLSMILDALLKTKSRVVLADIIDKNGLRMLHNMLKVYRRDFKKTPILRKLLKVLEYLENRQILTLEHIYGDAPCHGMESFRVSMLSLTEHDDKQVHQIARSFRDRWFPRIFRKFGHMDRDDGRVDFNGSSNSNRTTDSHNYRCDQGATPAVTVDSVQQSKVGTTLNTAVQELSSVPCSANGSTRKRKRKSRWDQPAKEKPVSLQHCEEKVESTLPQQSESNELRDTVYKENATCPYCYLNYSLQNEACHVENVSQNIAEDAPPGFSSPRISSLASSSVTDIPQQDNGMLDMAMGHRQGKFNHRLPVSYGIPMPIVQQFGSLNAENESWTIAPGVPFHPFPPLPPFPQKRKETLPCPATSMPTDENAGRQQDNCVSATCFVSENCPRTTKPNQPEEHFPEASNKEVLKRPRELSNDMGRRYFKQQKCHLPPWIRKRNGWNT